MVYLRERDKPAAPDNPFRFFNQMPFGCSINQFPDHIIKCLSGFSELVNDLPRSRADGYPLGCTFLSRHSRIVSIVSIYFFTILTDLIGRDKKAIEEREPMELLACNIQIPASQEKNANASQ